MPQDIKDEFGFAVQIAQDGGHPSHATPMSGNLRGVTGIKIYVLHVFQTKSKSGIATPQHDLDLIEKRLREAKERHGKQTQ